MKQSLPAPVVVSVIAVAAVIVLAIGFRLFRPESTRPVQTTPIKTNITPPAGGISQPAPALQMNVKPPGQ